LLAHDAVRSPTRQRVVETLVGRPYGLLVSEKLARIVKALEITDSGVGVCRHYPGIAPIAQRVGEPTIVLEEENRLGRKRSARGGPVNGVREVNIEIGDDRLSLLSHVGRRGKISLLNVLQLAHQCFLRRTACTGIPLDRALVDHDREREAGMTFRFRHDEFRGVILAVIRPVPVDDYAVNSATDHVGDLLVNLTGIG